MAHILKNKHMEVHIDLPNENYNLSRFDWTGKITAVKYKDQYLSGVEVADSDENTFCGKGFYNEFGINTPLGYQEAEAGGHFHKIGVGLLIKDNEPYQFNKGYTIEPAEFEVATGADNIQMACKPPSVNGYSYWLEKEVALSESGFSIHYHLKNTGEKTIRTDEYNHNFLSIDGASIGSDYILRFPFPIKPALIGETVNPGQLVDIGKKKITFKGTPQQPFFFSNLSGGAIVDAKWELENRKSKLGIAEIGNFQAYLVNLWGCGHVISPELFLKIVIQPGQSKRWSRRYRVYEIA